MEIRSAYGPHERVRKDCGKVSRTKQSFQAECDINNILAKYKKSGLLDHVSRYKGQYADVSEGVDYHHAMVVVTRAQEMFMSLPAGIRSQFGNDPGEFLSFVDDEENKEEMYEMGLMERPESEMVAPIAIDDEQPRVERAQAPREAPDGPGGAPNAEVKE